MESAVQEIGAEISTLLKIHHPNTAQFLGAVTCTQPYVIVTEIMVRLSSMHIAASMHVAASAPMPGVCHHYPCR